MNVKSLSKVVALHLKKTSNFIFDLTKPIYALLEYFLV